MAGTDELIAARKGPAMGNESASSSSTAGSTPPATSAADTGVNATKVSPKVHPRTFASQNRPGETNLPPIARPFPHALERAACAAVDEVEDRAELDGSPEEL